MCNRPFPYNPMALQGGESPSHARENPTPPWTAKDLSRRRVHHQLIVSERASPLVRPQQPQLLSAAKHLVARGRLSLPVLRPSIRGQSATSRAARAGFVLRGEVTRAPPRVLPSLLRPLSGSAERFLGATRLAFLRDAAFRSRGKGGRWFPRFHLSIPRGSDLRVSFISSGPAPRRRCRGKGGGLPAPIAFLLFFRLPFHPLPRLLFALAELLLRGGC